ncbi:toxin-coregulated pilus minor pilin TcpB [Vibrio cholerae]|uniref:toxin-coregulated pilus minor pilin TcpB n=1 Tax=Vibrio cholerae TaxID=666 RepID=UPI000363ED67|nr:toxin-coregulated pilus minor pilin TcpB [Vibrio cholerae]EGQ7979858.1 toxin-coregulated pilus minor pilin TcpB [Vibrio cholerae]EGQ8531466.1 toxin-coregulated pilus minor pilin TcpB [Vibrio cholerae]EGQ8559246.1 toxin-coregulated pilus minor pilin TcpB [Vibrio cholerae]RNE85960.1 toxin-coregulated pilus minor pilin TcpB [Vibrio cholerae]
MRKYQQGVGLLEAILASAVLGMALVSAGSYYKREAELMIKSSNAFDVIELSSQIQRYASLSKINNRTNPILKDNKAKEFKDADLKWLKLDNCPTAGDVPTTGNNNVLQDQFIACDADYRKGELSYFGSQFEFSTYVHPSNPEIHRQIKQVVSYFQYRGTEKAYIGDSAGYVISEAKKKGFSAQDYRIALIEPDRVGYFESNAISYEEFIENPSARENFLLKATKDRTLALAVSLAQTGEIAMQRDGSVAFLEDSELCWDTAAGSAKSCLSVRYDTVGNKTELDLKQIDVVSAKGLSFESDGKTKTPVVSTYETFQDGGRAKTINAIECPTGLNNRFAAVVSSFSTAGQNANFSSESAKDSQGTTQKDGSKGSHALLSGISLNWTLTNKVWDVTASIGIESGILPTSGIDSGSLLRNPKSLSFIAFQWCEN